MSDLSLCPGHPDAPICVRCRRRTDPYDEYWQSVIAQPSLDAGAATCEMYVEPRSALLERTSVWGRRA